VKEAAHGYPPDWADRRNDGIGMPEAVGIVVRTMLMPKAMRMPGNIAGICDGPFLSQF